MLNRVTNQTMTAAAQRNLQSSQSRLGALQERASTLKNITRASDDPAGTANVLALRSQLSAAGQYAQNISDGNGWLATADTSLGQATNLLNRVRDLTLQAANGTLNSAGKEAIAVELEGLNKDLLARANTQYLGRNLFAGTSDASGAFTNGTPPVFNGVLGGTVERRVSTAETVRVDVDGGAIFGDGAGSVFALVSNMVADIRGGANVSVRLTAIDDRLQSIINGRAEVGTRQAHLQTAADALQQLRTTLDAQRSSIEDADMGRVILDLKLQETNYQAALAVTAKVLQPTLMDFLR